MTATAGFSRITMQDSAGSTIATVTDKAGNVTSQYVTLGNGVQLTMCAMCAGVLTSITDLGTGVPTIVQDTAGNHVVTVTDLTGGVPEQYTSMSAGVVATVDHMGAGIVERLEDVGSALEDTARPINGFQASLDNITAPNFGDIISGPEDAQNGLQEVRKEAEWAADASKDINSAEKGGSKGDGGKSGIGKKARRDWTLANQLTLVGEEGPELISTSRPTYVSTAAKTARMVGAHGESGSMVVDYDQLDDVVARKLAAVRPGVTFNQTIDAAPNADDIQPSTRRAARELANEWDFV